MGKLMRCVLHLNGQLGATYSNDKLTAPNIEPEE